jgi:hypothetical protein
VVETITLTGMTRKFDQSSFDAKRNRLYLAASGNKTVEVIDLAAGNPFKSIPGFQKAQGIKYAADCRQAVHMPTRLAIASEMLSRFVLTQLC